VKHLFTFFFSLSIITTCFGQLEKSTTFRATANFNIVLDGLATNDAGVGLGFDASFFSKNKLQVLIETSADCFIGDKVMVIDPVTGKEGKSAAIYSIKAGPQFFITKNIALAATYGPAWHVLRDFDYTVDYGFKYSITGFLGRQKRFVTKVFMVNISVEEQQIQYLGIAAGVRF
jgi:hypothetical protein